MLKCVQKPQSLARSESLPVREVYFHNLMHTVMLTKCTLPIHSTHTLYPHNLPTQSTHTIYPHNLPTQSTHTIYPHNLPTQSTHILYPHTLPTQSTHTIYPHTLPTQSTHTIYPHSFYTLYLSLTQNLTPTSSQIHNTYSTSQEYLYPYCNPYTPYPLDPYVHTP